MFADETRERARGSGFILGEADGHALAREAAQVRLRFRLDFFFHSGQTKPRGQDLVGMYYYRICSLSPPNSVHAVTAIVCVIPKPYGSRP